MAQGREGHWKACCVAVCCIGKRASRRYRYVDVSTLSHVVVVYSSRCYLWLSVHGWVSEHNATCCDTQTDTRCSAVCVRLSICCWLAQYIYDLRLHTALQLLLLLPSLPITSSTQSSQAAASLWVSWQFLTSTPYECRVNWFIFLALGCMVFIVLIRSRIVVLSYMSDVLTSYPHKSLLECECVTFPTEHPRLWLLIRGKAY